MNAADTSDVTRVKDWLNRSYTRVCVENEATQAFATMTLTPNVGTYTMPSAVSRIKQINAAPPGGGYGPPLTSASLEQLMVWRQSGTVTPVANATSSHYALVGLFQLELFPTPANADTLQLYYVYLPAPLVNGTDVPVLQEPYATDLLEYGALVEAAAFKKDPDVAEWQQLYQDAFRRHRAHLDRRRGGPVMQLPVMGEQPRYLRRDIDVGA